VGALRRQIRTAIWLEAVGIALTGFVLGLVMGAVQLYYLLELAARDFPGLRFDYLYPYQAALLILPLILTAAVMAATGPAEAMIRSSLVEALEYE
jgi:ABC-type antimicrobial peptide transport system permease subunit